MCEISLRLSIVYSHTVVATSSGQSTPPPRHFATCHAISFMGHAGRYFASDITLYNKSSMSRLFVTLLRDTVR